MPGSAMSWIGPSLGTLSSGPSIVGVLYSDCDSVRGGTIVKAEKLNWFESQTTGEFDHDCT